MILRAVVYERYGSVDVLELREVPRPEAGRGEVLVRVVAASVNSWDWDLLRGVPAVNRIGARDRPRYPVLGADVAGIVEAVGPECRTFKAGEAVFGDLSGAGWGGFAEFVVAPESALLAKPDFLSFIEAAATPQAATLAFQGIGRGKWLRSGSRLLVNGAAGVGTFAIQMGKRLGAEVTTVDRGDKLDFLGPLGADRVIDYREQDFAGEAERYDLVLDVVASRPISVHRSVLASGGRYVVVGGSSKAIIETMLLGTLSSLVQDRKVSILIHVPKRNDLATICDWMADGAVRPVVGRVYPLEQTADAMQHLGEGRTRGKVVVSVAT